MAIFWTNGDKWNYLVLGLLTYGSHRIIGWVVPQDTVDHCFRGDTEAVPLLYIATNLLCLKYNKPHIWVTYKDGAPAPYAHGHPPNLLSVSALVIVILL
jgi:hypothetical protein